MKQFIYLILQPVLFFLLGRIDALVHINVFLFLAISFLLISITHAAHKFLFISYQEVYKVINKVEKQMIAENSKENPADVLKGELNSRK